MKLRDKIELICLGCFVLFMVQCSRRGEPRLEDLPEPNLAHVIERIKVNQTALCSLEGVLTIIFRSPDGNSAVGVNLCYLQPDFYKLEFKGVFGIDLGKLILADGNYWIATPLGGEVVQGDLDSLDLPFNIGITNKSAMLLNLLLPSRLPDVPLDSLELVTDHKMQRYLMTWSDTVYAHRIWVDPNKPIITREMLTTVQGDTLFFKESEDVKMVSGVYLPCKWRLQIGRGKEAYTAQVKLSNLKVNTGLTPQDFEIPPVGVQNQVEDSFER